MDQQLVDDILTSDSDEIADIKANLDILSDFVDLMREINALPDVNRRFYEDSRSLYQTTSVGRDIAQLEKILSKFFGPPVKPADKSLPRKLRKSTVVKSLGGIQKDQSLFTVDLKTGQFYGALWPWRRNKAKIEIHLGYCSDWMTNEDYQQLEDFVHQSASHGAFAQMHATIGGQIHGISLPSFLQMAEMEKSSFTLRVTSRHRVGELHLSEGELISADLDNHTGKEAAYSIISWDDVSLDIDPLNASKTRDINMPLMHILMESLKIKDEAVASIEKKPPAQPRDSSNKKRTKAPGAPAKRLVRLQRAPAPVAPRKRLPFLTLAGIGVGIFAVLAVIVVSTFHIIENRRTSDDFEELVGRVDKTNSFEQQIRMLNQYLEENPNTGYAPTIQARIGEINQKIEDRAFEQATLSVSGLPVDETYEAKAIEIFSQFREKYPNSRHMKKIHQSIAEIKELLDQYYYEELKRAARLDFNKRLETYRRYLAKFPNGTYQKDVEVLINDMGEKYLDYLYEDAKECEKIKRWDSCIEHCNNFIEAYAGLGLSEKAIELRTQLEDKRDYYQLLGSASEDQGNYQKSYQQLKSYLASYPQTTQRANIEKEIARLNEKLSVQRQWLRVKNYANNPRNAITARIEKLDRYIRKNINGIYAGDAQSLLDDLKQERQISLRRQQIAAKKQTDQARIQRLQQEQAERERRVIKMQAVMESKLADSSRYRANGDGTFTDLSTGLNWAILDSYQELGGCLTYEKAIDYIKSLRHGGHRGWRLPTANELAAIIKKTPYFPHSGAKWYWSAETAVKGYHSVANIVTAEHQPIFKRQQRAVTECGSVRAILVAQP
jgi:outer membrane protein assembly factor BamD (BamD/ComL family)